MVRVPLLRCVGGRTPLRTTYRTVACACFSSFVNQTTAKLSKRVVTLVSHLLAPITTDLHTS
jgi:hypothetical protein